MSSKFANSVSLRLMIVGLLGLALLIPAGMISSRTKETCRGHFSLARMDNLGIQPEDIIWREASASIGVPDMSGINEAVDLVWNGRSLPLAPGLGAEDLFSSGVRTKVPVDPGSDATKLDFSFMLDLKGSEEFRLLPLGRTTLVDMSSPWANPSFSGAFLPEERRMDESGFTAAWKVLDLNRNYPQQWIGEWSSIEVEESAFGVRLFSPVDQYAQINRAVKYAAMFIGLTFLIFFMIEVFNNRRIHPIQYLLAGLALCLFYLLLLSLSEHLGFDLAYLIAGLGVIVLISYYTANVVRKRNAVLLTTAALTGLYGFMYILLRNEDYALLMGACGLFIILAAVMHLTRKVDWYSIEAKREDDIKVKEGSVLKNG